MHICIYAYMHIWICTYSILVLVQDVAVAVAVAAHSRSMKNQSKLMRQIHPKLHQNGGRNHSKSLPGGLLEGSGGVLGPSWLQDGPKKQKTSENQFLGPPLGRHVGTKNRQKVDPRCNIFLIGYWIDFLMILGSILGRF